MTDALSTAEDRLFDSHSVPVRTRSLQLADPDLEIAVHETGSGKPVIFVHGSGMSAATWAMIVYVPVPISEVAHETSA